MSLAGPITGCPLCGEPTRDVERVEERRTPASVPLRQRGYTVGTSYTVIECTNGHRMKASGGKGPLGWRELRGMQCR